MKEVDFIEQRRHFLDLVDHDLGWRGTRAEFLAKPLRPVEIAPELIGLQQVDPEGVRIALAEERGFARLPRPQEKEGLGSGLREGETSPELRTTA